MKLHLFVFFCIIVEIYGCWRKKEIKPITTTTTTTTTRSPIEDEIIRDSNVHHSDAARRRGSKTGVETSELRSLSEELLQLDSNSVGSQLRLNYQGQTSSSDKNDVAPQPLFSSVNSNLLRGSTLTPFRKLLDNYAADVRHLEDNLRNERSEINAFLDAIMETNVMKKTEEFLSSKGLIKGPLRPQLYFIWFTPYSRHRGIVGSSGFEHVFLGEIKKSKVSGFHNWVFFQKEEDENDADYKGYMKSLDLGDRGEILKFRFSWLNRPKAVGSMFIGTSPELEMALYTICFYARPNAGCNLQMNRNRFRIKIYQQDYKGKKVIGSAYPEIF